MILGWFATYEAVTNQSNPTQWQFTIPNRGQCEKTCFLTNAPSDEFCPTLGSRLPLSMARDPNITTLSWTILTDHPG